MMTASLARIRANRLFNPKVTPPRQAWVENFIGNERKLIDIIDLHPRVFGVFPRIDYISDSVIWQKSYRDINYISMPTRNEFLDGKKKPWPQKGTGRARHGSTRSPIWIHGGWARGPRGPTTSFQIKPMSKLFHSISAMLSIKLAQNDLKIVDSLEQYNSDDPNILEEEFKKRNWGPSVLIIDQDSNFPKPLINSTQAFNHVNLMPYVALNPLSMCKHETMVITLDAIRKVEDKLLFHLVRVDLNNTKDSYKELKVTDFT